MMPSECGILISELEAAVSSGDSRRRTETLRRVTDLFLQSADRYSDDQVDLFDNVMIRLSTEIETRSRAELSRRLAALSNAPLKTVQDLAYDDSIEVAGPILTQSTRIGEEDVLAIAKTKGQQHLLAISQRPFINEATTDVLIHRGDREVVQTVASNTGARLTETGLEHLVERAGDDAILATNLLRRTDINSQHIRAAITRASQAVQDRLIAECPNLEANIRNAVVQAAEHFQDTLGIKERDYAPATKQIDALVASGKLNEQAVGEFAKARNVESSIVALARLCEMPVDAIERCFFGDQIDLPLIVARAGGLSWASTKWLLVLRDNEMRNVHNSEEAKTHFLKLHPVTAQRLLRFYRARNVTAQSTLTH